MNIKRNLATGYLPALILLSTFVAPIELLIDRPWSQSAIVAVVLYMGSWLLLVKARGTDPSNIRLTTFATSHFGIGIVFFGLLLCQVIALNTTARKGMIVASVIVFIFYTVWAFSSTANSMRTNFLRLFLVTGVLLIALIGTETGFWFFQKNRPENDYATVTWGHAVVNNSLSFREREFDSSKEDGVFRIMVLGDSLTWGAGLATDERYTSFLEERLRQTNPEMRFEVLNFGRNGAPTTMERCS